MDQLPIFVNLRGTRVIVIGTGDAADAKRRLVERAGGICVDEEDADIRLAFVALDDNEFAVATAVRLRSIGLLVNVVDRPEHCDFTTPAIVDRAPVLVAVGTGGASAGLAKALRQRIDVLLPQSLGDLAKTLLKRRGDIRARWPDASSRRRAIDAALAPGAIADPLSQADDSAVDTWIAEGKTTQADNFIVIELHSDQPDDLTLRMARLLGEADHIYHEETLPEALLNRARADAVRHIGSPPKTLPAGLVLQLRLPSTR